MEVEKSPTDDVIPAPPIMLVTAAAMQRSDGRWLLQRRPANKLHGGLWEFPGGKVEPGETPVGALVREVREELGIKLNAEQLAPAGFATGPSADDNHTIVILLYSTARWVGVPVPQEGAAPDWFTQPEISRLDCPPLDLELAGQLFAGLPEPAK
ncbi:8-oxo-dGTP diphosphatase [Alteripontixanthobacter maritimus]|uniref:8-oxo-dGTP diphosphatase n=1 Tax=Alteripontixanthobacter maritimus TaxID=2161824 RepID=A0A369Q445_9SPHN|nr:(deoxy)nucleoside triphosphate pyrophosphohydrolase [Alteripontixanthobacter maritimus]RDC59653.1 8-oxo-dGTP diphosphatase [Alteripontixanthobacter maritimus]